MSYFCSFPSSLDNRYSFWIQTCQTKLESSVYLAMKPTAGSLGFLLGKRQHQWVPNHLSIITLEAGYQATAHLSSSEGQSHWPLAGLLSKWLRSPIYIGLKIREPSLRQTANQSWQALSLPKCIWVQKISTLCIVCLYSCIIHYLHTEDKNHF